MLKTLVLAAIAAVLSTVAASARDQVRIVGSSTVAPFATAVAEEFARKTPFPMPIIESSGSSAGLALFCAGVGMDHPDIANASRRIRAKEWDRCNENGVTDIVEVKIGFDGIVIVNALGAPEFDLTQKQIYKALAAEVSQYGRLAPNWLTRWNEVTPSLPAQPINVIGPRPSSGTRDGFEQLALRKGARKSGIEKADLKSVEIRADGRYSEAEAGSGAVVQRLAQDTSALGIVGYSVLDQNRSVIKSAKIDGVEPTAETIADGAYPLSRELFFYLKRAHILEVPGLEEYLEEFMSETATGSDGYVIAKGLVPLLDSDRREATETAANLTVMTDEAKLQ